MSVENHRERNDAIVLRRACRGSSGRLVVGALEGGVLTPAAQKADQAAGGALSRGLKVSKFTGKSGQVLEVLAPAASRFRASSWQVSARRAISTATAPKISPPRSTDGLSGAGETAVTFEIDAPKGSKLKPGALAAHLAFGAQLRSYAFNGYRTKNLDEYESKLNKVTVATSSVADAKRAFVALEAVANGIFLARNLVNEPPNVLYPAEFARRIRTAFPKLGIKVEVLGEADMKKLGMGSLLGVGQGQRSARASSS